MIILKYFKIKITKLFSILFLVYKCQDEQRMSIVESLVFCKLNQYREQANRERFLLPEDASVNLFSDAIKHCIDFVK
jgi:hypothetical protein